MSVSERFQVVRGSIVYKREKYDEGDFLPEEFTARDRARHVYSRRISKDPVPMSVEVVAEVKIDLNQGTQLNIQMPVQVPNPPATVLPVTKTPGALNTKVTPAKPLVK